MVSHYPQGGHSLSKIYQKKEYYRLEICHLDLIHKIAMDGHSSSTIYLKDLNYKNGIWHLDLTNKIKTKISRMIEQHPRMFIFLFLRTSNCWKGWISLPDWFGVLGHHGVCERGSALCVCKSYVSGGQSSQDGWILWTWKHQDRKQPKRFLM